MMGMPGDFEEFTVEAPSEEVAIERAKHKFTEEVEDEDQIAVRKQ